jgi:hypothetical protein
MACVQNLRSSASLAGRTHALPSSHFRTRTRFTFLAIPVDTCAAYRRMKLSIRRALLVAASLGLLYLTGCNESDPAAGTSGLHFLVWGFSAVCLIPFVLAFVWWLTLRPSNDRDWSPEYARTPWAEINGDRIIIHNFRNCDYRTATDFSARWETKTVHLSKLRGLDLFMSYWRSPHIAHTLLSFDFGDEGRVCTSIETRRERHETYSAVRGFFRQYELYYVIGDEGDLVCLRTNYRSEDVYLYRLAEASPETYRALFLAYLRSANDLRECPRWYHATMNNCTTNIRLNAQASGFAAAWNWRILLNGHFDELLHRRGTIPSSLAFAETKARAKINDRAKRAGSALDFSERIRAPIA